MKVAFLSGTSILKSRRFETWEARHVATPFGEVAYRASGDFIIINRHGAGAAPLPPHSINYRANLRAVADLGYVDVVALYSVGSLQTDLVPQTLVSCADYVSIQQPPATYHDEVLTGGAPGLANNLLPALLEHLGPDLPILPGKVYVQVRGPRFETKAEIRVFRQWGDVIGMTLASEADLCTELGLRLTCLAMVDNYANGIEGSHMDFATFHEQVKANQEKVDQLFGRMVEIFGEL